MLTGRCLCGAVRWRIDAAPLWTGWCHCESCRRNCAAPVTAYLGVADGAWAWTGAAPAQFKASDHATRSFCAQCGTPVAYATSRHEGETHFYIAGLDDPEALRPKQVYFPEEALSWQPPVRSGQRG